MLTKITFTRTGCCSAIGNFAPGDTARLSAEMAEHLVEECSVARYSDAADTAPAVNDAALPVQPQAQAAPESDAEPDGVFSTTDDKLPLPRRRNKKGAQ